MGQRCVVEQQHEVQVLGRRPRHEHVLQAALGLVDTQLRVVQAAPPVRVGGEKLRALNAGIKAAPKRIALAACGPLRLGPKPDRRQHGAQEGASGTGKLTFMVKLKH